MEECYEKGGKLLVAGNGGSASDSEHIVGELMKGFVKPRKVSDEFRNKLMEADDEYGAELADKLQGAVVFASGVSAFTASTFISFFSTGFTSVLTTSFFSATVFFAVVFLE